MLVCGDCGQTVESWSGRQIRCAPCKAQYHRDHNRAWKENHRELLAKRQREWVVANPEKVKSYLDRPEVRERVLAQARIRSMKRKLDPIERMMAEVRTLTNSAIKAGRLVRGLCEVCSSEKVEAHHDDYGKPLDVRWLCSKHHKDLHRTLPPAAQWQTLECKP